VKKMPQSLKIIENKKKTVFENQKREERRRKGFDKLS
jgi:hypothetical protein